MSQQSTTIRKGDQVTKIGVLADHVWTVTRVGWNDLGKRVAYLQTFDDDGIPWTDTIPTDYLSKKANESA